MQKIKILLNEVALPEEQSENLAKLDEIELIAENAQKIFYQSVGVKASYLRGEVPQAQKVVKANPPSAA